jgi:signal transduction histidine kinase/CheY-like chemotaxis protein
VAGALVATDARQSPGNDPPDTSAAAALIYGGDARFAPYEFLDESGKPAGLNVDLINAVGRALGLKVTVRLLPWEQVRTGLMNGRIDVASMYRSPQRAREVDFAVPHELVYHEMFVRAGSPPLMSVTDLSAKRVLVETDTYSADALADLGLGNGLIRVSSEPEALQQLADGHGDAAVVTQAVGRPFRERSALTARIVPTGPPILLSEYAFVLRKNRRALLERLNEGVMAVKASGEYDTIYARWIRPDRSARIARIAGAALAVALVGIVLFVVWTRSLRRLVTAQTDALRREYAEKERALIALADSEKSLRQAQKMELLGRLAGGVAHDFNNLLTVILSYSEFLREEFTARGDDTTEVDEILAASERASRLTAQLLAFSRSRPLETVRIDLCAVVMDNRAMIQRLVGEHIAVEVVLPSSAVTIEAEPTQVEQILLNLGANARDAMPDGGHLTIAVGTHAHGPDNALGLRTATYATLRVTDDGQGMDEATKAQIFEPFFTTKDSGKGTGLGLATVFAHVTRMRGHIAVESAPGRGTSFHLTLPTCEETDTAPVLKHATHILPDAPPETILLAEDDDALRRAARAILEHAGHRVIEAKDGEEALAIVPTDDTVTMVVTDVVMPRRSGPRLVTALRERRPGLLVLYVSGYVQEGEQLDLTMPGTAYLPKPYTPAALAEAVLRLAGTRRRSSTEG